MVKASAQAAYLDKILPCLTEEEQAFFRRGKNAHTHAAPKAATRLEYAKATGLETLFGALYLLGRTDRLNELFHIMIAE
jgi:ribonuclease-3 family protein